MLLKNHVLRTIVSFIFLIAGILLVTSCNQQGRGFALPEGDIQKGKATFTKLKCNECHSVSDIDWAGNNEDLHVQLGGSVSVQKSYGQLVASVINPSHRIARVYQQVTVNKEGKSKMKNYNEVMTVQELVDIVTFLQREYKVERPAYSYPMY